MTFELRRAAFSLCGRLLFLLVLLGGPWFPAAATNRLVLKPDTCVRHAEQPQCILRLTVRFNQPQLQAFCLYLQHQKSALHCSRGDGEREVKLNVTLQSSLQLELRDEKQQVLASAPLKVAVYQPAQTRRRRGLGWNLL
ncbi:DUF3019 domain-containing protein [Rheinheimera sp. F8]|uniref:DUF3019 domain-containing protein n=1 Tax=Rheinheimera sp. F8 TaxID=1763998 RepID=UPI0007449122|nr:DUF3019 domain-containing protein [Rheinheimera sp. F8]ALZ74631.1 hypothetical protein ATY27_01905 [Rheinheimera sp. F8]